MSSGLARDAIFAQHATLRGMLAELIATAGNASASAGLDDLLRGRARAFCEQLVAHMAFEEEVLAAALRDVIGVGAVIHEQMDAEHRRQRELLAAAMSALEAAERVSATLADDVRAFANAVLVDMESEERGLLHADLDALMLEVKGG